MCWLAFMQLYKHAIKCHLRVCVLVGISGMALPPVRVHLSCHCCYLVKLLFVDMRASEYFSVILLWQLSLQQCVCVLLDAYRVWWCSVSLTSYQSDTTQLCILRWLLCRLMCDYMYCCCCCLLFGHSRFTLCSSFEFRFAENLQIN